MEGPKIMFFLYQETNAYTHNTHIRLHDILKFTGQRVI